jgi:hypothetical protein
MLSFVGRFGRKAEAARRQKGDEEYYFKKSVHWKSNMC